MLGVGGGLPFDRLRANGGDWTKVHHRGHREHRVGSEGRCWVLGVGCWWGLPFDRLRANGVSFACFQVTAKTPSLCLSPGGGEIGI